MPELSRVKKQPNTNLKKYFLYAYILFVFGFAFYLSSLAITFIKKTTVLKQVCD